MTTAALRLPNAAHRIEQLLKAPLWMWCLVALLAYLGLVILPDPPPLLQSLGDTDDATRLTQVREFMAGAPWLDTTLPRFGAPEALVSHWSRLVDLPLAVLIGVFALFLPQSEAELAVRAIWPLLLLASLLYVIARAADERGGRVAVLIALALTVLSFGAVVQFRPGRIDHHSVQNLAAIAGIFLLAGSFRVPRRGTLAGIVLGLGMAVGYEAILLTGASLAVAGLMVVWTKRGREGVERAGLAFAATLAVAFVATTAPSRWLDVHCDALSLNLVLFAAIAAAGLAGVLRYGAGSTTTVRLGALAGAGAVAGAAYLFAEPACLAGPFGQVDPAVYPVWLEHVSETQSSLWLFGNLPSNAIANALHVLAGLAAACFVVRKTRDDGALLYAGILIITAALCVLQIKLMPYAALLAILPLAVAISSITATQEVSAPVLQFGATMLLNQKTLLFIGALIAGFNDPATEKFMSRHKAKKACISTQNIASLSALPKGLAVSEIDMGPYLVALTSLNALAAPYHRIDKSIIESQAILIAPAAEAEHRLRALGATYVITCASLPDTHHSGDLPPDALKPSLFAGKAPAFLEAVPLVGDSPIKVWRLKVL